MPLSVSTRFRWFPPINLHVFQNLLSNALKYRKPDEPPRIHIDSERRNGHWVMSVRDNGIGFDQDQAERIFGLFKRLHGMTDSPGSGLGLAICKRIIERYHGEMWLNPKWAWARHSTFHYRSVRMTEPVYIFLAEDNPGDVDLLEEALREHNIQYKLFIARDGTEAKRFIDRIGKYPDAPCPDFILLDLNLPNASGLRYLADFASIHSVLKHL